MGTYLISGQRIDHAEESLLQAALSNSYQAKSRPLCLCAEPGVPMYIARAHGKYLIKRMPNSGAQHQPDCEAYDPPPELSGLGQVMGSAIKENPDEGITVLRFDFSLSKRSGRAIETNHDHEGDSVKADSNKLSLRGTLHYLWEEAGFNRWMPRMAGKRNWYVIHKYLYEAAANKLAKGNQLADFLYIPEPFSVEKKDEIAQRRAARMLKNQSQDKKSRRLMLAVGEVKDIAPSRFGYKITLKHCPDCAFMIDESLHTRLLKRFNMELGLWEALPETHLMMIATFAISATGIPNLDEVALINATENWIPFESTFEKTLLDKLTQSQRSFIKGLRYNLSSKKPLACAVLSDTDEATALYIYGLQEAAQLDEIQILITESNLHAWIWDVSTGMMPEFPQMKKTH